MKNKIIILGFDGASWNYILPLVRKGKLPNFKYLIENGATAPLESTLLPFTVPAWQSMFSGYNPGKIGCAEFIRRTGNFSFETANVRLWKGKMFWDRMRDKKILVLNIPFTYPFYKYSADVHVIPLEFSPKYDLICPEKIKNEIISKFNIEIMESIPKISDHKKIIKIIYNLNKEIYKMSKYLIDKYKYDISIVRFSIPDRISHYTIDVEEIKKCYIFLDEILGKFIKRYGKNHIIFVVSDHGIELTKKRFSINYFLYKKGFLSLKLKEKLFFHLNGIIIELLERAKLIKFKDKLSDIVRGFRILKRKKKKSYKSKKNAGEIKIGILNNVDKKKTSVYFLQSGVSRWIPLYIVADHSNYEKIRDSIIETLNNLKIENKKVILRIWKREDVYKGKYMDNMPDLILESRYAPTSQNIDKMLINLPVFSHTLYGIFGVIGENIVSGKRLKTVKIYDIAPTIYYICDYPVPSNVDGKVLTELFEEKIKPIKYSSYEKLFIKRKIKKIRRYGKKDI